MLTLAACTYNRANLLEPLITVLRQLECPIPFEVLIINNNSTDNTEEVLRDLQNRPGAPLRVVKETAQGIVPARNRAVEESLESEYLVFLDDDELPWPGFLNAAVDAFEREGAECVGGKVKVSFSPNERPGWLGDDLLGFLAEVDYGDEPFWIKDSSTPVWTANIAYRTSLFADGLRFDHRYSRKGKSVGGGEDVMMFEALLARGARIRYRPDMVVDHFIEEWRLKRNYFLKLHYSSGKKKGMFSPDKYERTVCGVPPFMVTQAAHHFGKTLGMAATRKPGTLRQAMNGTYAMGMVAGRFQRWREDNGR